MVLSHKQIKLFIFSLIILLFATLASSFAFPAASHQESSFSTNNQSISYHYSLENFLFIILYLVIFSHFYNFECRLSSLQSSIFMMLSFLRHNSIRLWIALLLSGVVSLLVLPVLQARIGLEFNLLAAAVIFLLFFAATGWVLNHWALNTADYLVAEAGAFERDGRYHEAERSFQKAVAIFDSFMISPFVKRKKAGGLGARLARFYLARGRRGAGGRASSAAFLRRAMGGALVKESPRRDLRGGGLQFPDFRTRLSGFPSRRGHPRRRLRRRCRRTVPEFRTRRRPLLRRPVRRWIYWLPEAGPLRRNGRRSA